MRSSQVKGFYSNGCFYTLTLILLVFSDTCSAMSIGKLFVFGSRGDKAQTAGLGFASLGMLAYSYSYY